MSTMSHLRVVTGWLVDLATITAGNAPGNAPLADAKAKIGATAGLLADDLPSAAFTRDSLRAMEFKFFPAYAELRSALSAWWDKNRPLSVLPVIATDGDGLSEDDLIHLESWNRLRERHVASGRLSIALDLERKRSSLFRYICRTDAEAERIAMHRGWLEDASEMREREHRTDEQRAHAAVTVGEAIKAMAEQRKPRGEPDYRYPVHSPETQTEAVAPAKPPRSRADDLALLAALRADPRASLERIAALREVLGARP